MEKIVRELQHPIDKFSKSLIVSNIEVLLNYCMRFYERQFVTREDMNHDALARFERLLDDYLYSGTAASIGIPTVKYFADKICLSPNYFGDLVKQETGKTALEIITAIVMMDIKAQLKSTELPIKEIAFSLGFNNMSFFNRYFKRHTGMTPQEYRNS